MPRGDQTGPEGRGPLTGRGLGICGRRVNRGFNRGYGYRRFWRQPIELTKEEEKKIMESEIKEVEQELNILKEELKN